MEKTVTATQCVELVNSHATADLHFTKASSTIRVAQIFQAARSVAEAYDAERRRLLEEMGTIDPDTGNLVSNPDGTLKFKTATGRKEFDAKHRDLLAAETTVIVPRLAVDDLEADEVTPAAIFPLLPFVDATVE